jgi:hypothetical protein
MTAPPANRGLLSLWWRIPPAVRRGLLVSLWLIVNAFDIVWIVYYVHCMIIRAFTEWRRELTIRVVTSRYRS